MVDRLNTVSNDCDGPFKKSFVSDLTRKNRRDDAENLSVGINVLFQCHCAEYLFPVAGP